MQSTSQQSSRYASGNLDLAYQSFIERYPTYLRTAQLDELRLAEYSRIDELDQIYLDYTGGGLYAASQLQEHTELLRTHVFGNPHSHNPTSLAMTELVDQARAFVLEYFNASPDEYLAIFTPNASGAMKLVAESYPFTQGSRFVLTFDNHNSVNGIREFARTRGAQVTYIPVVAPELRIDSPALETALDQLDEGYFNLFAFPAQSNFSGVQHPLEYISYARQRGWDVLLDCAAFAPTNHLDIGYWKPDYATFSFYKMFGYPTGLGCLLMRRDKFRQMRRPWFAGGTITIASVQGDGYYLHDNEAAFEDGTVDYLNIPAIETGLRHMQNAGMDLIHERVIYLTGWLLEELRGLRHQNGNSMVHVHGPVTTEGRGGTVTISLFDVNGAPNDDHRIEELANFENISLRTGCFCNPGAGEVTHKLSAQEMRTFFESDQRVSFMELRQIMQSKFNKSVSAVRVSMGIASNFSDVYHFMRFISGFLDKTAEQVGIATYDQKSAHHLRDTA